MVCCRCSLHNTQLTRIPLASSVGPVLPHSSYTLPVVPSVLVELFRGAFFPSILLQFFRHTCIISHSEHKHVALTFEQITGRDTCEQWLQWLWRETTTAAATILLFFVSHAIVSGSRLLANEVPTSTSTERSQNEREKELNRQKILSDYNISWFYCAKISIRIKPKLFCSIFTCTAAGRMAERM